jgi:hypothetical protein
MRPIQLILILLLGALIWLYVSRLRSRLTHRLALLGVSAVGVVLILRPDWANEGANLLGVGRGADLLIYLGLMIFGFLWLQSFVRVRALEQQLTRLARAIAIAQAVPPSADE